MFPYKPKFISLLYHSAKRVGADANQLVRDAAKLSEPKMREFAQKRRVTYWTDQSRPHRCLTAVSPYTLTNKEIS